MSDGVRPDVAIVIGGPVRMLPQLVRWKMAGTKIILRLAGPYYRYAPEDLLNSGSFRNYVRNSATRIVKNKMADHVVFQSAFVQQWWKEVDPVVTCPESVIYNGVDLAKFRPRLASSARGDNTLLVSESLYRPHWLTNKVFDEVPPAVLPPDKLIIVHPNPLERFDNYNATAVSFERHHSYDQMPQLYHRASVFLSVQPNASCPNSVIEALSSGLPVIGFRTGALSELLSEEAGVLLNGDPASYAPSQLGRAVVIGFNQIMSRYVEYAHGARMRAEQRFSSDKMVRSYLDLVGRLL